MKILRSIAAILVGAIVAVVAIGLIQMISNVMSPPPPGFDWRNQEQVRAHVGSLPWTAFAIVLCSYIAGSLVGGGVAAALASCCRVVHAGVIGALVLAMTVGNFAMLKYSMGVGHPDWMIVASLLSPLPVSMMAGKLVAALMAPPAAVENPPPAVGAFKSGEPPVRST